MKKIKSIACAVLGHSRITESCFGYVHCARCRQLLGDTLAGVYDVKCDREHGCATCQAGYQAMTWRDKLLVEKPTWLGTDPETWTNQRKDERAAVMEAIRNSNREREKQEQSRA